MNKPIILERPDGILSIRKPAPFQTYRLLILIHGWGGSETSMWDFTKKLPEDYWIISPRGSVEKAPGEYGWRPTILGRRSHLEENLKPANDLILRIDSWATEAGVDCSHYSLLGFSQGAALVYVLACMFPHRLVRAVILSGYPPRGLDLSQKPLAGKPFLITHGVKDKIIPVEEARKAIPALEKAGAQITYIEENGSHIPGRQARKALSEFLK